MQRSPDVKLDTPQREGDTSLVQQTPQASPPEKRSKKYHNGWNRQLENLVAEWADKSACYQWMHQKTETKFSRLNMYYTIPVIIMTTLTGTANFATESVTGGTESQKYVTFGIGAVSLAAGIISTVANFLRYAQSSEAHRVAAISWGKFQRFISIELSLHPNERMDAMSFLKMGRVELDRLIEQSPPIPPKTIAEFLVEFKDKKDIIFPEIAGGINHTRIFDDRESRLAKIAAEAAYAIQQKKGLIRQLVLEDIDKRIVSRTLEEREKMEVTLREEIVATVRALQPVNPVSASRSYGHTPYMQPREEILTTVPFGMVRQAKQSLQSQTQSRSSLAAQVASVAAARTQKTPTSTTPTSTQPSVRFDDDGPSTVRLEIITEDDMGFSSARTSARNSVNLTSAPTSPRKQ